MDAREIESLSMLSRGFEELRDVNPELSFNVILDILTGLNEYAAPVLFFPVHRPLFTDGRVISPCQ
jgi:serine/threonine-protein kinase 24/25/MST4